MSLLIIKIIRHHFSWQQRAETFRLLEPFQDDFSFRTVAFRILTEIYRNSTERHKNQPITEHLLHPDDDGLTALHIAAEHGHADVVLYLIRFVSFLFYF